MPKEMIRTTAIESLTSFQKNVKSYIGRLRRTKEPLLLTVNGKARLVVQDAEAYQALLDQVERARLIEAIRQGLREAEEGRGRPAEEVFAEMKSKYGF